MTQINQNFTLYAGDHKTLTFTITNEAGAAQPLAGATIYWAMGHVASSDVTQIFKSTASGITITNPAGGIFEVYLRPSNTKNLVAGEYYHEASMVDALGNVSTLAIGTIILKASLVPE